MSITYEVGSYSAEDTSVEVIYTNDEGFIHKRQVNIPHLEDGSVDEVYLEEILEGQLRGVENKLVVGAVTFVDPFGVTEPDPAADPPAAE